MPQANKPRPALEFGVKLQFLLANLPTYARRNLDKNKLNHSRFANETRVSYKTVSRWINGYIPPTDTNLGMIELVLFGPDAEVHADERAELRRLVALGRYNQEHTDLRQAARVQALRAYVVADTETLPSLTYQEIDRLMVDEAWTFDTIRYGEGTQIVVVPGHRLWWQPADTRLLDAEGNLKPLTDYFPTGEHALNAIAEAHDVYFPRRVLISGLKRERETVRIFACTNHAYENGLDARVGETFEADAFLGLGGIAAFLDRDGNFLPRDPIYMGLPLSCVVVLLAVAYENRRPICRTPYCLTIRKGIRYPDDEWINPATGRPVFSSSDPVTARFLFQSREPNGDSTDMFAANFNGSVSVNLNATDPSAWDGFTDDHGKNCVSWVGDRVTFASYVNGNGFAEKITREDDY